MLTNIAVSYENASFLLLWTTNSAIADNTARRI